MHKSGSIHKFWEIYRTRVMSPKAPPIQIHECQLAFYGGASAILGEMVRLGDEDVPINKSVQTMQDLLDEVAAFTTLILSTPKGQPI